jgi:hypothetical protein
LGFHKQCYLASYWGKITLQFVSYRDFRNHRIDLDHMPPDMVNGRLTSCGQSHFCSWPDMPRPPKVECGIRATEDWKLTVDGPEFMAIARFFRLIAA